MGAPEGRIIAIVGPTAAGKTGLAVDLAEALSGEVVTCDALQIREGLPVLTAKPTPDEQRGVRHHLLGAFPITHAATAAQYVFLANQVIFDLRRAGQVAILSGGTGLYLRALAEGLFAGPAADLALRQQLRAEAAQLGAPAMHRRLAEVDLVAAGRIDPRDYVRIERALEVFMLTGKPISRLQAEGRALGPRFDVLRIGLDPGVAELRERIAFRVDLMIENGLFQEISSVNERIGLLADPPIGYGIISRFLRQELSAAKMREELITVTARYAKRQRTWFRQDVTTRWFRRAGDVPFTEVAQWLKLSRNTEVAHD